jgi:hypothetical protein
LSPSAREARPEKPVPNGVETGGIPLHISVEYIYKRNKRMLICGGRDKRICAYQPRRRGQRNRRQNTPRVMGSLWFNCYIAPPKGLSGGFLPAAAVRDSVHRRGGLHPRRAGTPRVPKKETRSAIIFRTMSWQSLCPGAKIEYISLNSCPF